MIDVKNIWKIFPEQNDATAALKEVSVRIGHGERVSIVGRSASGKSTLLNVLCAATEADRGEYFFEGKRVRGGRYAREAVEVRRQSGYIGQTSDLLSRLNVLDNVKIAAEARGTPISNGQALEWLRRVGLSDVARRMPANLSGGQRQRVSVARTLACKPRVVFADEPTGSLDAATARVVSDLLFQLTLKENATLVLITHSPELAVQCDRQLCVREGQIVDDTKGLRSDEIVTFLTKG